MTTCAFALRVGLTKKSWVTKPCVEEYAEDYEMWFVLLSDLMPLYIKVVAEIPALVESGEIEL